MYNKNISWEHIVKAVVSILFLMGILTGCGRLQSSFAVKANIKQALPHAVILDVENGTRSEKYKFKKYTIDNNGVVFTYENYQRDAFFFSMKITSQSNDYCKKLFAYFSNEINEIAKKYHVEIDVISDSFVRIKNNVSHMEEIDNGINAMEEIYTLIEDYIPQVSLNQLPFQISLFTDYGQTQQIMIEKKGDWDEDNARQLLYMNFKSDVEMGNVHNVSFSEEALKAIPQKYINNLYINKEPYLSEDYEICFLYNVEDQIYYTPVGFGVELDYNGGVEDYLQREIITFYYPHCEYTILPNKKTSCYKIGEEEYVVKRGKEGLTFLKNGENMEIFHKNEISNTHTGATYYYWVSVYDFAMLMGMQVDKVEENGVYLTMP